MAKKEENDLKYLVALVPDFAPVYKMQQKRAFSRLRRFKGLYFSREPYDPMKSHSAEDAAADPDSDTKLFNL